MQLENGLQTWASGVRLQVQTSGFLTTEAPTFHNERAAVPLWGLLTGASNATLGNVAGAATATFSIVGTSANAPSSLPVWYGTSSTVAPEVRSSEVGTATPSSRYFETGIATFEMGSGAAEAAKLSQTNRKRAARV